MVIPPTQVAFFVVIYLLYLAFLISFVFIHPKLFATTPIYVFCTVPKFRVGVGSLSFWAPPMDSSHGNRVRPLTKKRYLVISVAKLYLDATVVCREPVVPAPE